MDGLQGVSYGGGFQTANQLIEKRKAENPNNSAFRFYLKKGERALVIFLEDEPPVIVEEHSLYINKRVYNLVCPGEGCPLCAAGERKSPVGYMSVIRVTAKPKDGVENPRYPDPENADDTSWEEDWDILEEIRRNKGKGALVLNPVQLLPAKTGTLGILARQAEKRGGLQHTLYETSRGTDSKSPSVGDNWDFEAELDEDLVATLAPHAELVDYKEALDVRTNDQLRQFVTGVSEQAAANDSGASTSKSAASSFGGSKSNSGRSLDW